MDIIIGTAGHIDHGKTALIKSLSGIDADRLKEEKERGITIVIGFAYIDLPNGERIGIVDVPGHERFIHNMLTGVTGVDLILLVVAADDGIMPQTREHLDILNLLNISHGIIVITKIDLVDEYKLNSLKSEIEELINNTSLRHSPIISVSNITGKGMGTLKEQIITSLKNIPPKTSHRYFRLPIDRVFSMQGFGCIVTGTAISGEIQINSIVRIHPQNQEVRIRGIQVHNQNVICAKAGQRTALNLVGINKESISRGNVISELPLKKTTSRFDSYVETIKTVTKPIQSYTPIRFYTGTSEVFGKIISLQNEQLTPGTKSYCQIQLKNPIQLSWGDKFIVREENAERTIAGGTVLLPFAKTHKKIDKTHLKSLEMLNKSNLTEAIIGLINNFGIYGIKISELTEILNMKEEYLLKILQEFPSIKSYKIDADSIVFDNNIIDLTKKNIIKITGDYHKDNPMKKGLDIEILRERLPKELNSRIYREWIEEMNKTGILNISENWIFIKEHSMQYNNAEDTLQLGILDIYRKYKLNPPKLSDLSDELKIDNKRIISILKIMVIQNKLIKLSQDIYLTMDDYESLKELVIEFGNMHAEFRVSEIRDYLDASRKLVVPLLEYMDSQRITIRKGDLRVLSPTLLSP